MSLEQPGAPTAAHDPDAWLTAPEQVVSIVGDHMRCGAGSAIRYVLISALALTLAGCGQDAVSKRPDWLTEKLEKNLIRQALLAKERDTNATLTRAFVVRATDKQVQRLGGWRSPGRDRTVYVLEVWGDMKLCHSAPYGVDPCTRTNGFTAVCNSRTLETCDALYFRLGSERLCCGGRAYDLDLSAKS